MHQAVDFLHRLHFLTIQPIRALSLCAKFQLVILFEYVYMQHGSMSWISTEKADIISVSVNDLDGKLAVPKEEGINSTLVWFDPEKNLQFTIDAPLGENDILHIAESVSLVETTK